MKRLSAIVLCFLFIPQTEADTDLSQTDFDRLVGEYSLCCIGSACYHLNGTRVKFERSKQSEIAAGWAKFKLISESIPTEGCSLSGTEVTIGWNKELIVNWRDWLGADKIRGIHRSNGDGWPDLPRNIYGPWCKTGERFCYESLPDPTGLRLIFQLSANNKRLFICSIGHKGHRGCGMGAFQLMKKKRASKTQAIVTAEPSSVPAPTPTVALNPTPEPKYELIGTGTGFVVRNKYVVTAEHVLDGCKFVSIVNGHEEIKAQTVSLDKSNDLGLLKIEKSMANFAKLRGNPDLRVGDTAINYGYPLMGTLSTSAKLNAGYVNSLAGINNDSAVIQYSAPTQPGNSGGPVLDEFGNVIGVVSSGLSKRYSEEIDHITQNINFATKSTILEGFLKANKVPFEKADLGDKLELPDIAEKAETFTVLVGCWE